MVSYEEDSRRSHQYSTCHEGRPLIQIIKHGSEVSEVVCQHFLISKNSTSGCNKDYFPGIISNDKLYFSIIQLQEWKCQYNIMAFDFKAPNAAAATIVTKCVPYPKAVNGKTSLLPFMSQLSEYIPPKGHVGRITNEEFFQNTIVKYYYKSKAAGDDGTFEFKQEHFNL